MFIPEKLLPNVKPRYAGYTCWRGIANSEPNKLHYDPNEPVSRILALTADDQLLHHDIYYLPPIRSMAFGRVVLLGDATHAMTPNLGQGAGQASEDAVILASI